MKINDICHRYNLSRKTVHFYIQEGLLHPGKSDNNYYSFNEANEEELKLVLRLRQAGVSIDNIHNIVNYPTCTNFFLFKQYFLLKKERNRIDSERNNISMLLEQIPPNGTFLNVMNVPDAYMKKEVTDFNEKDAELTARMTAIFLLTPFMKQEVDDYRQFIWNKIVRITERNLHEYLKEIAESLTERSAVEVYEFSTSLAKKFELVMAGERSQAVKFLTIQVEKLCHDRTVQKIWYDCYDSFITPVKRIYEECHKTLIREYTESYSSCMEEMKSVFDEVNAGLSIETVKELERVTDQRFDLSPGYYNDLFILFCMEDSVFISPRLLQPTKKAV